MDGGKVMSVVGVWLLSLVLVVGPWLAIQWVPVPKLNGWSAIYIGGALGGLVLEFTLGRGRVELPSVSVETEEDKKDDRAPFGAQIDIGFFARMASSGLAAVALLLVYYTLIDKATPDRLEALAKEPQTFGWAIFLGVSSPAVWAAGKRIVESRLGALETQNKSYIDALTKAQDTLTAAAGSASQVVIPLAQATSGITDSIHGSIASAAAAPANTADVDALARAAALNVTEGLTEQATPAASAEVASAIDQALGIVAAALP